MAATHDILHLKTTAELRFFVDNPSYYQPELVAAAQRELRRRGPEAAPAVAPIVAPAAIAGPPAPLVASAAAVPAHAFAAQEAAGQPYEDYSHAEPQPTPRPWLVLGSVAAVLLLAGLGFWAKSSSPKATHTLPPEAVVAAPAPPALEEAPASPIPYYNAESYVDKALAQVPAAEKRDVQRLNQYRAVSLRFWAAQNPSAHLIGQARAGQANPVFGPQVQLVLELWHDFDRTQVYSYSFGPVMADHLARMKVIAQYQREALKELANDVEAERPPTSTTTRRWLTSRPYPTCSPL